MRNNLADARASNLRLFAARFATLEYVLTNDYVFPLTPDAPIVGFFDLGGVDRNLFLPSLSEARSETMIIVGNTGSSGVLSIRDSGGLLLTSAAPDSIVVFFASKTEWQWFHGSRTSGTTGITEELRQVTAAGAQVISSSEAGLVINKAVASPTPVTLPSVTLRAGKPVRLVDWRNNVDMTNPVTVTPAGAEKIHNLSSWEFSNLSGGVILFPNTALGGWTIGG